MSKRSGPRPLCQHEGCPKRVRKWSHKYCEDREHQREGRRAGGRRARVRLTDKLREKRYEKFYAMLGDPLTEPLVALKKHVLEVFAALDRDSYGRGYRAAEMKLGARASRVFPKKAAS